MTDELIEVSSAGTEAAEVERIALAGLPARPVEPGALLDVVTPSGATRTVVDLERYLAAPRRKHGTVEVHTQESFAQFVNEHKVTGVTHIYADRDAAKFVAAFNDASTADPGWADHRAVLPLKYTPEWQHWTARDGELLSQVAFAEHIEDGLLEVHEPDGAYMLELSQTFYARTGVTFRQAHRLDSGEAQFEYVEQTTAGAGKSGDLTIPQQLVLGIAPFEGTQPYKVTARLRYRLNSGALTLGYKLDRPHDVLRSAFDDTVGWIATDTSITVLLGKPPAN